MQEYSHQDLMNMQEDACRKMFEMQKKSPDCKTENQTQPKKKSLLNLDNDTLILAALLLLFMKDGMNDKILLAALAYILLS
ncbi:MAG: hypothetical protein IJM97_08090 [Clostridia bacterium]|nr:hypothetical protein [Clostridia bacterium]MBQ6708891.1 hypothetical protein [Clostridia bacterium]